MTNIQRLKDALSHLDVDDRPSGIRKRSRDFYWFSPVLKRELDHVSADLIVSPKNEIEAIEAIAAAFREDIPITPRGTGTGNYGQAMPLLGGMVLNLSNLREIYEISSGRVVAGAGSVFADIDRAVGAHSGQELRIFPSTYRSASIGGFVAGGSGGIGSIHWGGLRDLGNIIRARIITIEESPRVLELEGSDVAKIAHAYGTNGVITQVEMPLAPSYQWINLIVGFDTFNEAFDFADKLSCEDGILLKELAVLAAPIAGDFLTHYSKYVRRDQATVLLMVAPHNIGALNALIQSSPGETMFRNDKTHDVDLHGLPPLFECTWNHTTLFAHHYDSNITYLQILYPHPNHWEKIVKMSALLGDESIEHLEFIRFDGRVACIGIPLIRYTTEERLDEIIRLYEDNDCIVFNPHRFTLEEGGMKKSDPVQLAFKREVDPKGLLNPGKMIAWENPNFDFNSGRKYLFSGN